MTVEQPDFLPRICPICDKVVLPHEGEWHRFLSPPLVENFISNEIISSQFDLWFNTGGRWGQRMFDYIVGNNKIEALVGPSSFNRKNNCQTVKGFQLLELYFNTKACQSLVYPALVWAPLMTEFLQEIFFLKNCLKSFLGFSDRPAINLHKAVKFAKNWSVQNGRRRNINDSV